MYFVGAQLRSIDGIIIMGVAYEVTYARNCYLGTR